jgi:signal-transduction protein with cAMP-binding, CBS, and nucleotidyltransferase domain
MVPVEKLNSIDPKSELWTAMEKMGRDGINEMPVMLENNFVGMLSTGEHRQISSHFAASRHVRKVVTQTGGGKWREATGVKTA